MAEKKMTKREMFTLLLSIVENFDVTDGDVGIAVALAAGLKNEIALLDRKRKSGSVDAKRKLEQNAIKTTIVAALEDSGEPMRATAIAGAAGTSVQRVTSLLSQLVEVGAVKRVEDKKVVTFVLP